MVRRACCWPAFAAVVVFVLTSGTQGSENDHFWPMLNALPHTAGVYASIEDPTLLCVTALRTELDLQEKTSTYLVHLKGLNGTQEQIVTYDYSVATPDVPNKATLVIDKEPDDDVSRKRRQYIENDFDDGCSNRSSNFLPFSHDDSNPLTITVTYTDYRTCFVTILPFGSEADQCMLWVEVEYLESFPQICKDAYADTCGSGFLLYSKDMCHF